MELETCQSRLLAYMRQYDYSIISLVSCYRWHSLMWHFKACSLCHPCQIVLLHRLQNLWMHYLGIRGTVHVLRWYMSLPKNSTGYIKAVILLPFPHQRKVHTENSLGRHAFCMLGRTVPLIAPTAGHIIVSMIIL